MPDKRIRKGCGKSCLRCWQNHLKHANKLKHVRTKAIDVAQRARQRNLSSRQAAKLARNSDFGDPKVDAVYRVRHDAVHVTHSTYGTTEQYTCQTKGRYYERIARLKAQRKRDALVARGLRADG